MTPISLFLADPQTLFREGLKALLAEEPFLKIIGEAATLEEASYPDHAHSPGVVLLENMSGKHPAALVHAAKQLWPQSKVIFLTAYEDKDTLAGFAQSKAAGVILKESSLSELRTAVQTVYHGGTFVTARVFPLWTRMQAAPPARCLTQREQEILRLAAQGHSVRQIAVMLSLSAKTVDAHKVNLMRKLQIHNKAHLVHYAFQNKHSDNHPACRQ